MKKQYVTVGELADYLHCPVIGDREKKLFGIALFQESTEELLTYIPCHQIDAIAETKAGAFLTRASIGLPIHRNYIITRHDPYAVLAQTIQFLIDKGLYDRPNHPPQISNSCAVSEYVSIGHGSVIGENTVLCPGAVIGENVTIGNDCYIGANTVIGSGSVLGNHVIAGACCSIGTENFEYYQTPGGWIKIPAVGSVRIGHNVRIGGNVVIEKGTIGITAIGDDTQIDNLVQVGHEVKIGTHCHIVACVALAGWAEIKDHVTIYGQAAVSNRVKIGRNAVLLARTGADKNIKANAVVSGFPAQNHQKEMRFQAFLRKLFRMDMKGREVK